MNRLIGVSAKLLPCLVSIFISVFPSLSWAQLENENLIVSFPPEYKIDFKQTANHVEMQEWVPKTESIDNWTEMITVQIFHGAKNIDPSTFRISLQNKWSAACKDSTFNLVWKGEENGYPVAIWIMWCPLNPSTGKPENTWVKAMSGNDSFYLAQKAFKFMPTEEQIVKWTQYLSKIGVCDSRINGRECARLFPKTSPNKDIAAPPEMLLYP